MLQVEILEEKLNRETAQNYINGAIRKLNFFVNQHNNLLKKIGKTNITEEDYEIIKLNKTHQKVRPNEVWINVREAIPVSYGQVYNYMNKYYKDIVYKNISKITVGATSGTLEVIEMFTQKKNNKIRNYCTCKCSCGNIVKVRTDSIQSQKIS